MSRPSADAPGGLQRFRDGLDPALVREIAAWDTHPELAKLHASLHAITDRRKFLNTYAEAIVARHLIDRGCRLEVEVLTPRGRSCDFGVRCREQAFFLHVKRLSTDRSVRKRLSISSRLRYLERIARPYVVNVRFREGLTDEQMQRYVTAAADFIKHARVGDEQLIRDVDGQEIGGCRIIAPWQGSHVNLTLGRPSGFIDESPRMRKLLRKAYRQFMPGAVNVILICSSHAEDEEGFGTALLGSHIERWDAAPPEGRRVAHGRDDDGFWHGSGFPESLVAGWFQFRPRESAPEFKLLIREEGTLDEGMREALVELFG